MNRFATVDAIVLRTDLALFGIEITIRPMKSGAQGVNGNPVDDDTRLSITGAMAIRSEWAERVQIGGQGVPTPAGAFKMNARGVAHTCTVMPSLLAWTPAKGDLIEYADRLGQLYRISEVMPDGESGLHFALSKV